MDAKISNAKYIKGTCESMCPQSEVQFRIREKLLHFYEQEVVGRCPCLIKEFRRSAAGVKQQAPRDLRTPQALLSTVYYLLDVVLRDNRKPYHFRYDFIFDRFRAVRQDIVIQNFDATIVKKLLEPIVMFLAYSRYECCELPLDKFDPKICEQHLLECLKSLILCYDEIPVKTMTRPEIERRTFIEALYLILKLEPQEAYLRCLELPKEIADTSLMKFAKSLVDDYKQGNVIRALSKIARLPHILCGIASMEAPKLRHTILRALSEAYSSPPSGGKVSVDFIRTVTLHSSNDATIQECEHYKLRLTEDRNAVICSKSGFDLHAPIPPARCEGFVRHHFKFVDVPAMLMHMEFKPGNDK